MLRASQPHNERLKTCYKVYVTALNPGLVSAEGPTDEAVCHGTKHVENKSWSIFADEDGFKCNFLFLWLKRFQQMLSDHYTELMGREGGGAEAYSLKACVLLMTISTCCWLYEPLPQSFLSLLSTFRVTHSSHESSLFASLPFCSVSDWMLIHTPVSTSPLPDNDKNHCHYYKGMARSRVIAHWAFHGLVRAQTESATSTHLSVFFEKLCVQAR